MKHKLIQTLGVGLMATTCNAYDLACCDTLQDFHKIYENDDNPFIQEVEWTGRAHNQWNYTDGEYNGRDFSAHGYELRRLRTGLDVKFLNAFKFHGQVNLEKGEWRDTSIGFDSFDDVYLEYDFGDLAGFEDVTLGYGRYKVNIGGEEHESSKKIKTIERSNINNFYAPDRSTGVVLEASRNKIDYALAVYTSSEDEETFAGWDGGVAYYAHMGFEAGTGDVLLDFVFNDTDEDAEEDTFGYSWAASVTYDFEVADSWDLFLNATYGEEHDGDDVYGVVIMPYFELIEDKLEGVLRYQYAHAQGDSFGGGSSSRGPRAAALHDGITTNMSGTSFSPKGDESHTIYAGLNYFLCDHNAKFMAGVEYETLDGDGVDLEATTFWGAFRFFF